MKLLSIDKMEIIEIFKKYERYKVFPLIYSIKDTLNKYYQHPQDLCQLCFINPVDSDESDNGSENRPKRIVHLFVLLF